jgi:putative toxin-antitoxin system antitoxin component (TIGR02293 family)
MTKRYSSKIGKSKPESNKTSVSEKKFKRVKVGGPSEVAAKKWTRYSAYFERKDHALRLFRTSRFERVQIVKSGVPAGYVKVLSANMSMPIERFYHTTGLVRPTVDRKIRASKLLNQDESERVIGIARLIGQAQDLVRESGNVDQFDAGRWVGGWLQKPLPALGGRSPDEFMDTVDGRALVSDLLSQQQSSAYG